MLKMRKLNNDLKDFNRIKSSRYSAAKELFSGAFRSVYFKDRKKESKKMFCRRIK